MLRDDFIESDEWQRLVQELERWKAEMTFSLRNAGDFATSRYYAGILDSIDSFITLPERVFDGEPKPEAPEGVRELPNHPRPTKTLF